MHTPQALFIYDNNESNASTPSMRRLWPLIAVLAPDLPRGVALPHAKHRHAQRLAPREVRTHYNLAIARLGRSEAALGHFAEVERLSSREAPTAGNHGVALVGPSGVAAALDHREAALGLRPDDRDAQRHLAKEQSLLDRKEHRIRKNSRQIYFYFSPSTRLSVAKAARAAGSCGAMRTQAS